MGDQKIKWITQNKALPCKVLSLYLCSAPIKPQRFIFKYEMLKILKCIKIKEFQIFLQRNHCISLYFHVSYLHCSIIQTNSVDYIMKVQMIHIHIWNVTENLSVLNVCTKETIVLHYTFMFSIFIVA